jgi:hypothetical protein
MSGNPYLSLLDEQEQSQAARIGATATLTFGVNPDSAAKARQTAGYLGVPPALVEARPEDSEREAQFRKLDTDTQRTPTLRQKYTDADFMKLARDDSGVLSGIETVVRRMMSPRRFADPVAIEPVMSGQQYSLTVRKLLQQNPALDPDTARAAVMQRTQIENGPTIGVGRGPAPSAGSIASGLFSADRFRSLSAGLGVAAADALGMGQEQAIRKYDVARSRAERNTPEFETSTGKGLYSGAQSVVDNAPGIILSVLSGSPIPGLAIAGAQSGGQAYGKYRSRGGTPGEATAGALLEGGIEVATEALPMGFMVRQLGKAGATDFVKGLLAREIPGEQLATLAQDAVDTAIANPNKTWGEYIAERPDAAYQTLLATLVQSGAMGGANAIARRLAPEQQRGQDADAHVQTVQELTELVAASKLAQRAPDSFTALVREMTESGQAPVEMYVDGEQLANVLNQSGVDMEALALSAPNVLHQLQAAVPGADVRLPVAELVALGPEFTTPLLDHLRESPEAMSRAEAQTFMSEQGAKIQADVERMLVQREEATAFKQQVEQATAQFEQELTAAGRFRAEVNKAYATLLGNFYAVQALRAGVPLADMLQRYNLRIVAQTRATALLDQDVPLRQGPVENPAFQAWFGDSKVVDPEGKPMVVYHGTAAKFTKFNMKKATQGIAWFTNDKAAIEAGEVGAQGRGYVMDLYAAVKNPAGWKEYDKYTLDELQQRGYDGVLLPESDGTITGFVFEPTQLKSASRNRGTFDPSDASILRQGEAQVTRGSFDPATSTMALLAGADLSTFIHESGHFFLEVQADLAARIQARISAGEDVTDGERQIVADMGRILDWFGIQGDPQMSALDTWVAMSLEEKREHHESWARGFERYVMEGKAPSLELQTLFARFRAWLVSVYKTLAGLNVEISDDVRQVMNRMLASDQAIAEAQDARTMGPMFQTPEQAGMTPQEYADYQALAERATAQASAELDARLMKDMKWLARARDKALKEAQAAAKEARAEVEREVRAEVMGEPIYRAWAFLTGKLNRIDGDKKVKKLGEEHDNLFTAIARMGGLDREQVRSQWGLDVKDDDFASGLFGQPVLRKTGGMSIDAMAERLLEAGYLLPDQDGKADLARFEELFDDQRRGVDRYSFRKDYAGEEPIRALDQPEFISGRLLTSVVKDAYKDAFPRLRDLGMLSESRGTDPDVVAETFGFASGQQLVRTLAITPEPEKVIDELTDFRTLQKHGDISSPEALNRAADEAVHNELRARVIANELKALAKANNVTASGDSLYKDRDTVNVMAKAAQEYAAQVIARQQIRNLRPQQYATAEARAAKLATQALGKSTEEAAMHKRNQLVNNYATKSAYEAQAEVRKGVEFFRKVVRGGRDDISKTRDWDMVQAARAVLADYGVGSKGETAKKYLEAVKQYDPATAQVLADKVDVLTANAKPLKELTVEEFRGLVEEIQSLWYLAKRSRQVEIDGQLVDIDNARRPLVERMEAIGIPDRVPGEDKAVTDGERRIARLRAGAAALRRVESWADAKDGSTPGPFRKYVWQPVKDAATRYRTDKAKYLKRYRDLLGKLDVGQARIEAPELGPRGYTFGYSRGGSGKAEILHALLHTGNWSNKRKLLLGRQWATENVDGTLDTTRWDAFLQRMIETGVLTKADFDFAQGVWDMLEEMKPLAQRAHRDVFGRYFDEVSADSFTNQFGTYRGGYVPAMTDAEVVKDAATRSLQEIENQALAYAFPATAKGFTKSRVEYNQPLLLDLRVLSTHIDKVLLFSHMEQPIRDVRKILTSKQVSMPLHRIDPSAFDSLLTPWMNRAARQTVETKVAGDNGLMRFFSKMRSRTGMAAMFANVVNTAQQVTGLSIAAVKVRPRHLVDAMAQFATAPRQTARAVAEASPYMATRMDNEVAAMSDAIEQILLNPSLYESAQAWMAKHAYFMQSAVDNVIGPIVWTGAYNQYLEAGHSELDARRLADAAVRQTQGSTLPEDVSNIETGNAFVRMFTQFAGYFNMQANLLGTEFANVMHEQGLRKGMGRGVYVFTLGFLVPAMVSELIVQAFRGGPEDEDKDGTTIDDWLAALFKGNLRAGLAMLPGVGQVLNAGVNTFNRKPYDDRISTAPAISMIESAVSAPHSVYKAVTEDGSSKKAVRDVATLISLTTGLPANAIARPLGYVADVEDGKVAPTSAADAVRGAITGAASPDSKR